MLTDAQCDRLVESIRKSLATDDEARAWVRDLMEKRQDLSNRLKISRQTLSNLQGEFEKCEHNLKISQGIVVQLSEYIKHNCPTMALYEALEKPPRDLMENSKQ
jgi:hypothetical protein